MTLHEATNAGDVERVKALLEKGVNPNELNKFGKTALFLAVCGGYEEAVRLLLQFGVDVNARYQDNVTALHWAADPDCEHPHMVKLLLVNGADVNARDIHGFTPLTWALPEKGMGWAYWNPEAVKILRDFGGQE